MIEDLLRTVDPSARDLVLLLDRAAASSDTSPAVLEALLGRELTGGGG